MISSVVMRPAMSEYPQARGPCPAHHGVSLVGGRTPSPERSIVDASPAVQPPVPSTASQNPHSVSALRSTMQRCLSVPAAGIAPLGIGASPVPAEAESLVAPVQKPVPPTEAETVCIGVVAESTQYTGTLYCWMLIQMVVCPAMLAKSAIIAPESGSAAASTGTSVFHGLVSSKGRHTADDA